MARLTAYKFCERTRKLILLNPIVYHKKSNKANRCDIKAVTQIRTKLFTEPNIIRIKEDRRWFCLRTSEGTINKDRVFIKCGEDVYSAPK